MFYGVREWEREREEAKKMTERERVCVCVWMRRRETEWVYVHVRQYCERVCPSDVMLKKRRERERERERERKKKRKKCRHSLLMYPLIWMSRFHSLEKLILGNDYFSSNFFTINNQICRNMWFWCKKNYYGISSFSPFLTEWSGRITKKKLIILNGYEFKKCLKIQLISIWTLALVNDFKFLHFIQYLKVCNFRIYSENSNFKYCSLF